MSDIASAIEGGIASQSDLVTSLSLAFIGGLLFLFQQARFPPGGTRKRTMQAMWTFWVALVCAGAAIVAGYVLSGILLSMAPPLYGHSFDTAKSFFSQDFGSVPVWLLWLTSLIQFIVFIAAIPFGIAFVVCNDRNQ